MEARNRCGKAWATVVLAALSLAIVGCRGMGGRGPLASSEPTLIDPYDAGGTAIVAAPEPRAATFVDRHPILSRPRYYYQSAGENPLVKATAATVIGIPAGVLGEVRQIVVGRSPEARPY